MIISISDFSFELKRILSKSLGIQMKDLKQQLLTELKDKLHISDSGLRSLLIIIKMLKMQLTGQNIAAFDKYDKIKEIEALKEQFYYDLMSRLVTNLTYDLKNEKEFKKELRNIFIFSPEDFENQDDYRTSLEEIQKKYKDESNILEGDNDLFFELNLKKNKVLASYKKNESLYLDGEGRGLKIESDYPQQFDKK